MATPGRLNDLMNNGIVSMKSVSFLVSINKNICQPIRIQIFALLVSLSLLKQIKLNANCDNS